MPWRLWIPHCVFMPKLICFKVSWVGLEIWVFRMNRERPKRRKRGCAQFERKRAEHPGTKFLSSFSMAFTKLWSLSDEKYGEFWYIIYVGCFNLGGKRHVRGPHKKNNEPCNPLPLSFVSSVIYKSSQNKTTVLPREPAASSREITASSIAKYLSY